MRGRKRFEQRIKFDEASQQQSEEPLFFSFLQLFSGGFSLS